MRIHQKLNLGFLGTSLIVAITGFISWTTNINIHQDVTRVTESSIDEVEAATEMAFALQGIQMATLEVAVEKLAAASEAEHTVRAEDEVKIAQKNIKEQRKSFKEKIANARAANSTAIQIALGDSGLERSKEAEEEKGELILLDKIQMNFFYYEKLVDRYLALAVINPGDAENFLDNYLEEYFNREVISLIREYEEDAEEELVDEARQINQSIVDSNSLIAILIIATLLISIILSSLISRSISKPIITLKNAAVKIGKGELDTRVKIESGDEVETLANAINQMADDLGTTTVSKSYVDNIIKSMVDTLIIVSPDARITMINQATLELLGYEENELIRKPIGMVCVEATGLIVDDLVTVRKSFNGNNAISYLTKDGSKIPMSLSVSVMQDDTGTTQGVICVAQDITERKQGEEALLRASVAEAAKQTLEIEIIKRQQVEEDIRNLLEKEKELNELKSHFVTMTSHEFRTPLATILSSADILQKYSHKLREEQKFTKLQQIQITVNHMTQLLNDVLLIGKAEAGKLEYNPTPLEPAQFCRNLVEQIQLTTDSHTIAFCSQGQCTNACMDEKLLRHILSNLLSNAIKYSPQGGTVHFDLIYHQETVTFQVRDEGIGIPEADQTQLFNSFHRASNVGTISGTGLGLAIVKKSVDLHGGKITVESQVGVGTTFAVTLPFSKQG